MSRFFQVRRRGFTLMELLTVMVIMGILMTAGIVSYVGARRGAEMRGALSTLQSSLALARQHAVSKRRTTAVVFRLEGTTNCYYIFEKNGEATKDNAAFLYANPPGWTWPADGAYVCNMRPGTVGRIGKIYVPTPPASDYREMKWTDSTGPSWQITDSYGYQVSEKMFVPPGIECKVDSVEDSAMILFYSNGKSEGVGERIIKLKDKMGTVTKTMRIYPLLGLVKVE